ncbi:MAG: DUF3048 domain-containing protein [Anaerosomatales bacterium]
MKRGTLVGLLIVLAVLVGATAVWYLSGAEDDPAADLPEEVYYWPLTGEVAPDADSIRTRVVSVKVENSAAARPQAGLAEADVVYETISEGGIPRFNALFHSSLPDRVGPVRSARLSDSYLVPQYGALFAYSGANETTRQRIRAAGIDDLGMEGHPALYERDTTRSAPHNVFASVAALQAVAGDAGFTTVVAPRGFLFGDVPGSDAADADGAVSGTQAPSASQVAIPFAGGNDVVWAWDESAGGWLREVGGAPHADEDAEQPYRAANVVIMYAEMRETDMRDAAGSVVLDIRLDGSGEAVVLRDGRRYDLRWAASDGAPPRFEDAGGEQFPLAVGTTWIEVVPPGHNVTFVQ